MIPFLASSKTQTKRDVQDSRRGRGKLRGRNDKPEIQAAVAPWGEGRGRMALPPTLGSVAAYTARNPLRFSYLTCHVCVLINV